MTKPVFWFYGNERQCRKTWNEILAKVQSAYGTEPNVETCFCGFNPQGMRDEHRWTTTNDILHLLSSEDLFDPRPRIIKMRGLPEEYTKLANWLDILHDRNILVIWSPFGYIKPGTKQWITAKTSKLYKEVKRHGKLIEHPVEASDDSAAFEWIREVGKECDKEIEAAGVKSLVRIQGRNLDKLTNCVQKIATYQLGKKVSEADVLACCSEEFYGTVWRYLEDLDYKRHDAALGYLQQFYAEGKGAIGESFYGRVSKFFGAIIQHFQFLLLLKDACGNRLNAQVAEKALSNFKKTSSTKVNRVIAGEMNSSELENRFSSAYLHRNIQSSSVLAAFKRRKSELYRILLEVYYAMFSCRFHSGDEAFIKLHLDVMTLVICGKLNAVQASQMRGRGKL